MQYRIVYAKPAQMKEIICAGFIAYFSDSFNPMVILVAEVAERNEGSN